jgi:hypothetical protein
LNESDGSVGLKVQPCSHEARTILLQRDLMQLMHAWQIGATSRDNLQALLDHSEVVVEPGEYELALPLPEYRPLVVRRQSNARLSGAAAADALAEGPGSQEVTTDHIDECSTDDAIDVFVLAWRSVGHFDFDSIDKTEFATKDLSRRVRSIRSDQYHCFFEQLRRNVWSAWRGKRDAMRTSRDFTDLSDLWTSLFMITWRLQKLKVFLYLCRQGWFARVPERDVRILSTFSAAR